MILLFIFSCGSKTGELIGLDETEDEIILCSNTDVLITNEDNIVFEHATNPVIWKGTYNDSSIKINFKKDVGTDGESETYTFILDKTDNCPKIERAYKFYDGNNDDISAITEMVVLEFYIKDWETDKKISGLIVYRDPHDKLTYSRKFWIEFTENNFEIEDTNHSLFDDCFASKLPIDIDMNNDDIIDYQMISEKRRDIGNTPQFSIYTLKLISTYDTANLILSPLNSQSPYSVIFEAPFTSENTRQYFNGTKNALDVFYEFDTPYESYNYFLDNNLTYKKVLENNKEDYYIISMSLDNKIHYGWIKFKFNSSDCEVEILETFLNQNPNQHISVD